MLIGKDFDKIELDIFGLKLLEPNAFIGDVVIFLIAIGMAYKIKKIADSIPFFNYWKGFFFVFGFGFLLGGLGHLLFYYTGVFGKYPSWYIGIIATHLIEMSFISIFPNRKWKRRLKMISFAKMIIAIIISTFIFYSFDLRLDQLKGLLVPTINSIIGMGLTLGILGFYYQRKIDDSFRFFWVSTLILIPSTVFQSMKINFSQWFDRNDISHVLIIISVMLYYKGIQTYYKKIKATR